MQVCEKCYTITTMIIELCLWNWLQAKASIMFHQSGNNGHILAKVFPGQTIGPFTLIVNRMAFETSINWFGNIGNLYLRWFVYEHLTTNFFYIGGITKGKKCFSFQISFGTRPYWLWCIRCQNFIRSLFYQRKLLSDKKGAKTTICHSVGQKVKEILINILTEQQVITRTIYTTQQ